MIHGSIVIAGDTDLIGGTIHSGDMDGMIHIGDGVILIMQDSTIHGIMDTDTHIVMVGIIHIIMAILV